MHKKRRLTNINSNLVQMLLSLASDLRMKKTLFAIAILSYLFATTGVEISTHYCMKKLISVKLFEHKTDVCEKCGMSQHQFSDCCHTVTKVVKLQQDQDKYTPTIYKIELPEKSVAIVSDYLAASFFNYISINHQEVYPPPLLSMQDNYLKHNVFRI